MSVTLKTNQRLTQTSMWKESKDWNEKRKTEAEHNNKNKQTEEHRQNETLKKKREAKDRDRWRKKKVGSEVKKTKRWLRSPPPPLHPFSIYLLLYISGDICTTLAASGLMTPPPPPFFFFNMAVFLACVTDWDISVSGSKLLMPHSDTAMGVEVYTLHGNSIQILFSGFLLTNISLLGPRGYVFNSPCHAPHHSTQNSRPELQDAYSIKCFSRHTLKDVRNLCSHSVHQHDCINVCVTNVASYWWTGAWIINRKIRVKEALFGFCGSL